MKRTQDGRVKLVMVSGKDITQGNGGHSAYVRAYARAARAAGYDPEVFCIGNRRGPETSEYGRIHWVPLPFAALMAPGPVTVRSRHAFFHLPLLRKAIARHLREERGPVIIHGFGVWAEAGARVAEERRRRGWPVRCLANCYTVYREEYRSKYEGARRGYGRFRAMPYGVELFLADHLHGRYERNACLLPDRLLVNYDSVRRFVEKAFGPVPRLEYVPYASELAFLPEKDGGEGPEALRSLAPADAPLIVSVSRHDPRKGMDVLLKALALLRRRGVAFRACLTSSGEMYEANRVLARDLGLPPSQVALPGYVPDVRPCLRAADVYCLPSLEEHSGSVAMLEAMQMGRGMVVTAIDGIPEDVTHDEQAWLVPPGDPEALAAGLESLLTSPERRQRLGQAARVRFLDRFSAGTVVEALWALYDREARAMGVS